VAAGVDIVTIQVGDTMSIEATATRPALNVVVAAVKATPDGGEILTGVCYDADGAPTGLLVCAGGQCLRVNNSAAIQYSEAIRDALKLWMAAAEATA
jgi:hypothetical protein